MMRFYFLHIAFVMFAIDVSGQAAEFHLSISDDTVLLGNYFEIEYRAENLEGEFDLPDFENFVIVSGPNHSTSMSIANGQQQSSSSVSFLLKPKDVDVLSLPPAYFNTKDKTWEVGPRDIMVLPNPDGIITESRIDRHTDGFDFFGNWSRSRQIPKKKKKKKLKETKI